MENIFSARDVLILIGGFLFLCIWWRYGRESIGNKFTNLLMRRHSYYPYSIMCLWGIRVLLFFCVVIFFISPRYTIEREVSVKTGKDIILMLDISRSMLSDDVPPSRIEKAKTLIGELLQKNKRDAFGYGIFAGRTFLMSPLSSDTRGLEEIISDTSTDTIDQTKADTSGTNIGDALILAIETLEKSNNEKVIILLTDGRANVGIDPLIAARKAALSGIPVYTIAIGTKDQTPLSYMRGGKREYFYTASGSQIIADIDEPTLEKIAETTNGFYFSGEDAAKMDSLFEKLEKIVLSETKKESRTYTTIPLDKPFIIVIVIFSIMHIFLARRIMKKYQQ